MNGLKTCFKRVDYDLSALLHYIEQGDIGLPDIQRPFVWSNTKVRDLFDSMYRGFPVGYLLFWENALNNGDRVIGITENQRPVANRLIVDGQQRLTSLYAVFNGRKVLDSDFRERKIEIAFRPRDGAFDVADAAIRRDPEWIKDISELWSAGDSSYTIIKRFLTKLEKAKGSLLEDEIELISHNLDRLFDLRKYPFTALEIAASVSEEEVADIFVRINSEGVKLNQADFILTLMSVFWDEGRAALEAFCREARVVPLGKGDTSFNYLFQPDPDQLLRVSVAVGFLRGRLKAVYNILRGKDLETGEIDSEKRNAQFTILKEAQGRVLDLNRWHQFLTAIIGSGYRITELISSQSALLYSYVFYLLGRDRCGMNEYEIGQLIKRWFFFSSLTGRYTSSPESVMDGDLNRVRDIRDASRFSSILNEIMLTEFTTDYWNITLPAALESSSARNPALFAHISFLVREKANALFSHNKVIDLLDPLKRRKKPLERHHLFPRAWLEANGVTDRTLINQQANMALLEWPDNLNVSNKAPSEYFPVLRGRFSDKQWGEMAFNHALPEDWHLMPYETFLKERRKLMAAVIRKGFETL